MPIDYAGTRYRAADLRIYPVRDDHVLWKARDQIRAELHEGHQSRIKTIQAAAENAVEGTWSAVEATYSPAAIPLGTMVIGTNSHVYRLIGGDGSVDPVSMTYTTELSNVDGSSSTQWIDLDYVPVRNTSVISSNTALVANTDYFDSAGNNAHTIPLLSALEIGDSITLEVISAHGEKVISSAELVDDIYLLEQGNRVKLTVIGAIGTGTKQWAVSQYRVSAVGWVSLDANESISVNTYEPIFDNNAHTVIEDTGGLWDTTDNVGGVVVPFNCDIELFLTYGTTSTVAEQLYGFWYVERPAGTDLFPKKASDLEVMGSASKFQRTTASSTDKLIPCVFNTTGTARTITGSTATLTDGRETQVQWRVFREWFP